MKKILITGACGFMGKTLRDCIKTYDDIEIAAGVDIAGNDESLQCLHHFQGIPFDQGDLFFFP